MVKNKAVEISIDIQNKVLNVMSYTNIISTHTFTTHDDMVSKLNKLRQTFFTNNK